MTNDLVCSMLSETLIKEQMTTESTLNCLSWHDVLYGILGNDGSQDFVDFTSIHQRSYRTQRIHQ